jgi:glycosyltransferase involved in cell wall biosynthesis
MPHIVEGLATKVRRKPCPPTALAHVSVVIPCFNYGRYVSDAISSVLTQEGVSVEVIVVDDRSTDDSREVIRAIAARDSRVHLLEHSVNSGPVTTFNDGLALATGDYIVRLDADDLLTPGALQRAAALGEAFPSVGLIYGHPLHFSGPNLPDARSRPTRWVAWPGYQWLRDRVRTGLNVITSAEVVMRRSIIDVVGGQRPLPHTHDMEMWLRIATVSDVAYIEGVDQAWHREHGASLSQRLDPKLGDISDRQDAFRTLFDWSGEFLKSTPELRLLAERALADEALQRVVHMHNRGRVDPDLRKQLLEFVEQASTGDQPLPSLAAARRAMARGDQARPRPWQVARALQRRLANDASFRRWHRHGVFHKDGE